MADASRSSDARSALGPDRSSSMVAIIGATGSLGFGIAIRLARAGMPVAIGSRDRARVEATLARAIDAVPDGRFTASDYAGAVAQAELVVLGVPYRNHAEVLDSLRNALTPRHLLIDATVPLAAAVGGVATRMLGVWQGSAAQQARELLPPGARVVSALHTVSAGSLADLAHPLEQDVLLCGDSHADKVAAAELIERIEGLRCVDCGPLAASRITEALTALMIEVKLRYTTHAGIRLTGLPIHLWE